MYNCLQQIVSHVCKLCEHGNDSTYLPTNCSAKDFKQNRTMYNNHAARKNNIKAKAMNFTLGKMNLIQLDVYQIRARVCVYHSVLESFICEC